MINQTEILPLIFLPIVSAVIVLLISKNEKLRNVFSVFASLVTLLLIIRVMPDALKGEIPKLEYIWSQSLGLSLSFKIDGLGYLFSLIAALVGFLTILFSVRDLEEERDLGSYYMWMLLFIGSMIGLVLSNDLITLFIFWELISLCSWGLIGFWKDRSLSAKASMKAFLMTHISSLPLLIAILSLHLAVGSYSIPVITDGIASQGASPLILAAVAMFIIAVIAKSAQIPLHTWLLNAMEAPSPVSALLHSATMVKAGVFLVIRMLPLFSPLFIINSSWYLFLASIGILSMLVAIHMALIEKDIKRILAYSTISHIGVILLGIGIGTSLGVVGGLFHLLNHAMFKACLFLCAGSVIYRVGTRNIEKMGGLAKKMPITAAAFLIAAFSASGVPPFNGFASKLMIYEAALTAGGVNASIYVIYCFIAVYVSAITLAVFLKTIHSVFFGQIPSKFDKIKESPLSMLIAISILAGVSIVFGVFPQLPVSTLILPAVQTLGITVIQPTVTMLGYMTLIGSYQATLIAILLALSFGLGGLIYLVGVRTLPKIPVPVKYQAMIGGEDAPIITYEDTKVSPSPFSQSMESMFQPLFYISKKGGFDIIWNNLARGIIKISNSISKNLISKGGILLIIIIIAGVILNLASHRPLNSSFIYTGILLIVIGSLIAISQKNLTGFLAWASISWIGRILIEFGTMTPTGLIGGFLDIVNIPLILLTLVLTTLTIKRTVGTIEFRDMGGLARKMPVTAGAFLVAGLALAGVPPFSGWWSEYHLFMAAVEIGRFELIFTVILASAFTISFVLRSFNLTFYGESTSKTVKGRDTNLSILSAILAILCVTVGIYPDIIMSWIYPLVGGL